MIVDKGASEWVYINLNTLTIESVNGIVFHLDLKVNRKANIILDDASFSEVVPHATVIVWAYGTLSTVKKDDAVALVRSTLDHQMDQLINDYLAANPKE